MGAKHTPGPWQVSGGRRSDTLYGHGVGPDGRGYVALVTYSDRTPADHIASLADARLIAAAPDLLRALIALYGDFKALADSGDAGNWRLEDEACGKLALAAMQAALGYPLPDAGNAQLEGADA